MVVLTVVAMSDSTAAVIGAIVIAFVNNSFSAPYYPAVTAITPSVVTEDDLAAANALSGTIDNFALAFGPALSAVLLLLGPPPVAFAVNGLTFLFSAFLVTRISVRGKVGEVEVEADAALAHGGGRASDPRLARGDAARRPLDRVRIHVRPGDRAVRTDHRGVPRHEPRRDGPAVRGAGHRRHPRDGGRRQARRAQPHGGHPRGLGARRRHPAR